MGLFIVDHLQSVFNLTQEPVGGNQVFGGFPGDVFLLGKAAQGVFGLYGPQVQVAPAPDQLLGLSEEFNFPDAAPAEFYIMPVDGDDRAAPFGIDLALDGMDVLDGCKIKVSAPDKRNHFGQEFAAGFQITGDRPGLDHGGAFPVLADGFIVGFGGGDGDGYGSRSWVRPQSEVGPEDITVAGPLVDQLDDEASQPNHVFLELVGLIGVNAVLVV